MEAKKYTISYLPFMTPYGVSSKVFKGIKVALAHAKIVAEKGATDIYLNGYDYTGHRVLRDKLDITLLRKYTYGK